MIKREFYTQRHDGVNLYATYDDAGYKIMQDQTGAIYDFAVDVEDAQYTYNATDEPVDAPYEPYVEPDEGPIPADEALNIILGEG